MNAISAPQRGVKRIPVFFDTLQFVHNLSAAGMPTPQAEALAKEQSQLLRHQIEQVATKADLKLLEEKIEKRFQGLEAKIDARFQDSDARFHSLEARIGARFQNIEARLKSLEVKFENLEIRMDTHFKSLEERLEIRIDTNSKSLEERLETKLAHLQLRLGVIIGGSVTTATGIILTALKVMR